MYNATVTGANACLDDGAPFSRLQVSLNGQNLEDIQQCARNANAEVKLSADQGWYKNEGSFCGYELLNNELLTPATYPPVTAGDVRAYSGAWGDVANNIPNIDARQSVAVSATNPYGGEARIAPLGILSGLGRMKQYLPLAVLGEINLTLFTAPPAEAIVQRDATANGDYSLQGVFCEYDIVVPHPAYMELLQKVANDPAEAGLMMPYESTITATSGVIGASAGTLSETSIIVSRATQNLLRAYLIQQPQSLVANINYPSYSCFAHANTFSIQYRAGSLYYPSIPAEGDASMFAMTMSAYGSAGLNANSSVINRVLWANTTTALDATPANGWTVAEGFTKFGGADSFVPCFGFQTVKGKAMGDLAVDGLALSGSSGSQLVVVVRSAPTVAMTPLVGLVALRFIEARAGSVRVVGA